MSTDRRRDLRDVMDEMERYLECFQKEIEDAVRNNILGSDRSAWPFVAGFSFNLGPEGKPAMQVFGNNLIRGDGFRSPINEQVVDEKNSALRVLLEMPGVEKEDIGVDATEENLVGTAERDGKK